MLKCRPAVLIVAIIAFHFASPAFAANVVLFDSTADAIAGYDSITAPSGPLAFSFTTTGDTSRLTDVKINLHGTGAGTGSITVELYSNNPSVPPQPGSVLATIGTASDSSITSASTLYDFPLSTPYPLAPNTRYWIYVSTSNSSVLGMNWSGAWAGTGVAGEYYLFDGAIDSNGPGGPFIGYVAATAVAAASAPAMTPLALLLTLASLTCVGIRALCWPSKSTPMPER